MGQDHSGMNISSGGESVWILEFWSSRVLATVPLAGHRERWGDGERRRETERGGERRRETERGGERRTERPPHGSIMIKESTQDKGRTLFSGFCHQLWITPFTVCSNILSSDHFCTLCSATLIFCFCFLFLYQLQVSDVLTLGNSKTEGIYWPLGILIVLTTDRCVGLQENLSAPIMIIMHSSMPTFQCSWKMSQNWKKTMPLPQKAKK